MRFKTAFAASTMLATCMLSAPAIAGNSPYIGEIQPYGFNFCPAGWAAANGQILSINSNQALFALIGTIYGGDGRTTFALPNLQGRVPIHQGRGPGLRTYTIGEVGGSETNTLNATQLPSHNHQVAINNTAAADSGNPTGNHFARSSNLIYEDTEGATSGAFMAGDTIANAGGNQPVNNIQPYLVLNYCIATQGIFPPRS